MYNDGEEVESQPLLFAHYYSDVDMIAATHTELQDRDASWENAMLNNVRAIAELEAEIAAMSDKTSPSVKSVIAITRRLAVP